MRVSADRIAVFRARPGLGDMLLAIPALRALRGTAPRAHITLIALESSRWVAERFGTYVNALLPFPGFPGLGETEVDVRKTVRFLAEAQEEDFDLVLQLHNGGVSANAFAELLGAKRTAGLVGRDLERFDEDFYVAVRPGKPEEEALLRVVTHLGARPTRGTELEFPIEDEGPSELADHELEPRRYACVQAPGNGIAEALSERGLRVVDPERMAGELSLDATAALLRDAAVTVCDDGWVSQLAEAVGARRLGPDVDELDAVLGDEPVRDQ
jgi:ADP-heptose:LPS heptosyltransferase